MYINDVPPLDMADDSLFEFLHMEIVSHVYKEHESRGDNDKVAMTSSYSVHERENAGVHCWCLYLMDRSSPLHYFTRPDLCGVWLFSHTFIIYFVVFELSV